MKKVVEEREKEGAPETVSVLSYSVVNGTTLKYSCCPELSQKFKLGNSAFNYEIGYKPADWNTEEKSLALKHASKYEPATGKLESTESLKFGSPQLGPVRVWTTVSIFPRPIFLLNEGDDLL